MGWLTVTELGHETDHRVAIRVEDICNVIEGIAGRRGGAVLGVQSHEKGGGRSIRPKVVIDRYEEFAGKLPGVWMHATISHFSGSRRAMFRADSIEAIEENRAPEHSAPCVLLTKDYEKGIFVHPLIEPFDEIMKRLALLRVLGEEVAK